MLFKSDNNHNFSETKRKAIAADDPMKLDE